MNKYFYKENTALYVNIIFYSNKITKSDCQA